MSKSQQGYYPIQAELFIPFLSHPSVTFKPTCTLFASFLSSPCSHSSGLRSPPLSTLSYQFSVTFKLQNDRWHSENAKDGYVKESLKECLLGSQNLGL